MHDKMLSSTPARKGDQIWIGILIGLLVPLLSFFAFFVFTYISSVYVQHLAYSFRLFYMSATTSTTFLRTATLCCIPNAGIFFWLIQRQYINAPRGIIVTTMVLIIAIVAKEML